jgi:uncharacterized protein
VTGSAPARSDHLTVADEALEPKRLAMLPGGHFDAYTAAFDQAAKAAQEWFMEHLLHDRSS